MLSRTFLSPLKKFFKKPQQAKKLCIHTCIHTYIYKLIYIYIYHLGGNTKHDLNMLQAHSSALNDSEDVTGQE